jgi:hypothetical protein
MVLRETINMSPPRVIQASRPIVVKVPAPMSRGKGGFRRHVRKAFSERSRSLTEKHRIGALVGAGILGLIDKAGIDLPTLPFLGKAGTAGLAAWALGKYGHSAWADDAATGMLSIAVYELAREGTISGIDGVGYVGGMHGAL